MSDHLDEAIEELAGAVLGPRRSHLSGGDRDRAKGLIVRVERIEEQLSSGDLKMRIPVPIWVAVITTAGGVLIQLFRG